MLARQFLQDLDVGGVPGLGLFLRRQAQGLEQDLLELLWRVDLERLAG